MGRNISLSEKLSADKIEGDRIFEEDEGRNPVAKMI
jgi:hypothetical protein